MSGIVSISYMKIMPLSAPICRLIVRSASQSGLQQKPPPCSLRLAMSPYQEIEHPV